LTLFAFSFYSTWMFYAIVYYIICLVHGDFEEGHMPHEQGESGWVPCVLLMEDFTASFLFSLETQHTIGYGSRQTTPECGIAVFVMSTQSIIGCLIQTFMVGLVFAKLSNPNKR
jgi:potassium inwardly-rectifying channel subfamily J